MSTDAASSADRPAATDAILSTEQKHAISLIWDFLNASEMLDNSEPWPGFPAVPLREYIVPDNDPTAGPIPLALAHFLKKDLRNMQLDHRTDWLCMNMAESTLKRQFNDYWLSVLHSFLVAWTNSTRPRSRGRSGKLKRWEALLENLEGFDIFPEDRVDNHNNDSSRNSTYTHGTKNVDDSQTKDAENSLIISDLQKGISTMASLFPEATRPTGKEDEPFTTRLLPICYQMNNIHIPARYQPSVTFSLLSGPARDACDKLEILDISLEKMIEDIKLKVLYDSDIQDRRISRWTSVEYSEFRHNTDNEEKAPRKCIDFMTKYQKDLPDHMRVSALLYNRYRTMFRDNPWCETLYQRTNANEDPKSFAQKLISAAANYDLRLSKKNNVSSRPFHAEEFIDATKSTSQPKPVSSHDLPPDLVDRIVAFFAKTPPPPRHRRPQRFQRFRNNNYNNGNYRRLPFSLRKNFYNRASPRNRRICFGCKQEGHFLRDCPKKSKYSSRFQHFIDLGTAAAYFLDNDGRDLEDDDMEMMTFFASSEAQLSSQEDDPNEDECFTWIISMLDTFDSSCSYYAEDNKPSSTVSNTHSVLHSIPELTDMMSDLTCYSSNFVNGNVLLDTGAPRTICSKDWLRKANWIPLKKIALGSGTKPFSFAGHPVQPLYAALLAARIHDLRGKVYHLKIWAHILPATPIPFIFGLVDQRSLGFDICLREGNARYLTINHRKFHATFPLIVSSHVWLRFVPVLKISLDDPDWKDVVSRSLESSPALDAPTQFVFMNEHKVDQSNVYLAPPWRQDGWNSPLLQKDIRRIHDGLKHPEKETIRRLIRKLHDGERIPDEVKDSITNLRCTPCATTPELPRKPKLSLPFDAMPNITVSLDVMSHKINNRPQEILVMLDYGDMFLKMKRINDRLAETAFNAFYSRWISFFDSPMHVLVDRGSNLCAQLKRDKLSQVQTQLLSIPTEAPWSLGINERSHRYIHKSIDRLLLQSDYNIGTDLEVLLSDVEVGWNFVQHNNNVLPHYHRFGMMPRVIGSLDNPSRINERIALMELARRETDQLRATDFIIRALHPFRRNVHSLRSFNVNEKVCFYRNRHGWRIGIVAAIEKPTITVSYDGKMYPTHENRIRPYFGEISIPPDLQGEQQREDTLRIDAETPTYRLIPLSEILNHVFSVSGEKFNDDFQYLPVDATSFRIVLTNSKTFQINSDEVFITVTRTIKDNESLSALDSQALEDAKLDKIKFLMDKKLIIPIHRTQGIHDKELQKLKWVKTIKTSTTDVSKTRYRARLVSASHVSIYRHSVHGNASTIALSSCRILTSILPTWMQQLLKKNDRLIIFTRDATKAFHQADKSQRLIIYVPPEEFFLYFPQYSGHIWKSIVQLYGEVEAGLYWYKTFIPWLLKNFHGIQQSIYDPSLLLCPTMQMDILICTDDTLVAIPESQLHREEATALRFECRERQITPTNFKGMDFTQSEDKVTISQNDYLTTKGKLKKVQTPPTNAEMHRKITEEELSQQRTTSGKLAWIATATAPLSACAASIALQGSNKKIPLLHSTAQALISAHESQFASLNYVPLDFSTIHIRIFTDGSFQNLQDKHSQIDFIVALADKHDKVNITHWHSSRASRRPTSTEESELLALDLALNRIRIHSEIIFQLLGKEVPTVVYIDNQTLWQHLIDTTVTCLPEVMHRCREHIEEETLFPLSACSCCNTVYSDMPSLFRLQLYRCPKTNQRSRLIAHNMMLSLLLLFTLSNQLARFNIQLWNARSPAIT